MKNSLITDEFDHKWIHASASVPQKSQYLMIVMHGRGDSLDSFTTIKNELKIPEMNYLLLNAPRAYDDGFTWYAFEPRQRLGILKSRKKILKLLEELALLGWSSDRIFLYGFSQGALMSCDLAMFAPQAFAGIVAISGYIYFFEQWKKDLKAAAFRTPWLVTHGFQDDLLPIAETRAQIKKLQSVGLPITWKEFLKEHEIDLNIETNFIRKWVKSHMKTQKKSQVRFPLYQISSSNSKQRSKSF